MKDNKLIDFSEDLNLNDIEGLVNPEGDKGLVYECYAICNHRGTLSSGHYYAKCKSGGQWFELNDSNVELISNFVDEDC